MEADREQREQAKKDYATNRTAEIFSQKGFKKHLKDQGLLDGEKGKQIKQGIKQAKSGNYTSEFGADRLEQAMSLYGKRTGAHNGDGEFDNNDFHSTMLKAGKQQQDMYQRKYDNSYASQNALDQMKEKLLTKNKQEVAAPPEMVKSDTLTAAEKDTQDYELGLSNAGNVIAGRTDEDTGASAQETAANDYNDDYKFNVKTGLKLSGTATRGPNSGINPGEGF